MNALAIILIIGLVLFLIGAIIVVVVLVIKNENLNSQLSNATNATNATANATTNAVTAAAADSHATHIANATSALSAFGLGTHNVSNPVAYADPHAIGLMYVTKDSDTSIIFQDVQNIITLLQKDNCRNMSPIFTAQKNAMIAELKQTITKSPVSCAQATPILNAGIASVSAQIKAQYPTINASSLTASLNTLVTKILSVVCTGGLLDVVKLDKLLTNAFAAICY